MRWLNRGKGSAKMPSPKEESLDATIDSTTNEAKAALAVARENARARGAKQIEERILLTEMAARLRVALFAEVRTPRLETWSRVFPHGL